MKNILQLLLFINSRVSWALGYIRNSYINNYKNKTYVYTIKDCHRNAYGQQIIVAKIIDSPRSVFTMSAIDLVLKRKDILCGFNIDDIVNIVGLATTEKEPKVTYNKPTLYKFYSIIAMLFGAMLVTANITSSKLITVFGITMTGGALCYPLTYILGDIITEVYGYKRARQLIWGAVICNILLIFFIQLTIIAPPSIYWHNQKEFALILGAVPRIVLASLVAYWCGEFTNSYIMAKFKIAYKGKNLLTRIISSTIVSITVDTLIFILIAYTGVMSFIDLILFLFGVYIKKILCEFLLIPLTIWIINRLKVIENLDIFDINTNFTPFSFDVLYSDSNNRLSTFHREESKDDQEKCKNPYSINNIFK